MSEKVESAADIAERLLPCRCLSLAGSNAMANLVDSSWHHELCPFKRRESVAAAIEAAVGSKDAEIKRLEGLAYIGEHHFPDTTYKRRMEECVAALREAEAELIAAREIIADLEAEVVVLREQLSEDSGEKE